ncbi:hypothetical protein [Virgibacillus dokdonensis]|uniref:hypothetical protein n=1 Tax=Virgibacillus dokdonensis TaxID=302167 RepID=UPI00098B5954|nr:hypothetical protein [Virgibacillus dokdonensis]
MELSHNEQKELYEEMLNVNEENIEGAFFVSSIEELKRKAIEFLMIELEYDQMDLEDIDLEIRWKGKGLYSFWGRYFTNNHSLVHISEIFEDETEVLTSIFLGNLTAIERERSKWYEYGDFIYAIWNNCFDLVEVVYSDEEEKMLERRRGGYLISELRELDNYGFYDFLRQYAEKTRMGVL